MPANVTIQCRGVTKRFGDRLVLDRVDLTIGAGSRLGLLGKSGAGKSTLLRIIAALDDPTAGAVTFETGSPGIAINPKIGMVFQNLALWPHLTARQHVEVVLRGAQRRQRRAQAETLLEELRLPPATWNRAPGELSGGEAQRVAIARALAIEPDVLLFDEPLAHVDEELRHELLELLESVVHRHSVTTIYVTHAHAEARRMADQIVVIENGRIKPMEASDQRRDAIEDPVVCPESDSRSRG